MHFNDIKPKEWRIGGHKFQLFDTKHSWTPKKVLSVFSAELQLFNVRILCERRLMELFQRKLCCQRGCSNSHCLWVRSSMFFDLNVAPLAGHSHPERRRSMKSLLFGWRAFTLTVLALRLCKGQPVSLALCVISASKDQLACQHSDLEMSACLTNLQKPQRWVDSNL